MEVFQTVATVLALTAFFGFLNERLVGLQQVIGRIFMADHLSRLLKSAS